jgi:integrase
MPTKQEMFEKYVARLAGKDLVKNEYIRWAREWRDFTPSDKVDPLSREALEAFFEHETRKHNYGSSSQNMVFRVIGTIYMRSNMDWPYNRGEAPTINEEDVNVPAIDPELLREMITAVKVCDNPMAKAYLALSSIYGLRRGEILGMSNEAINLPERIIYIRTLKHGRSRSHLIPEQIVPYIEGYDFDVKYSTFKIWHLWQEIEYMVKFDHVEGLGWHSIRRTLDTELQKVLGEGSVVVKSFMRWKQRTSSDMTFRYSAVQYVGRKGTTKKLEGNLLDADKKIFSRKPDGTYYHPFLGAWEGD